MTCEWPGRHCTRKATHEGVRYEDSGSGHDDGPIVVVPLCPSHAQAWAYHGDGERPERITPA